MPAPIDFQYAPASDVDAAARWYADVLGARVERKVRGMGTTVACVRLADAGTRCSCPATSTPGGRSWSRASTTTGRRWPRCGRRAPRTSTQLEILEIPPGPCASFRLPDGQRGAVCRLVRPGAATVFDGRFDP